MSQLFRSKTRVLAIIAGVLFAFSFPPFGIVAGFGAFIALVPILIAIEDTKRLRDALSTAYLMMFVVSLIATYWVGGWRGEGTVDPFLMVGGIALALVHPLFLVIPIITYDAIRRRFSRLAALVALPVIWVGFEYWHASGDLSFPWLNFYNTQTYNTTFIQFIDITGSYGLSFVIVMVNALLYVLIRRKKILGEVGSEVLNASGFSGRLHWWLLGGVILLFGIPYTYGLTRLTSSQAKDVNARSIDVTIIQPNINPWDKWSAGTEVVTDSMFRATRSALALSLTTPDLVLWPETAITYPVTLPWQHHELRTIDDFVASIHTAVLTGIPDREEYMKSNGPIPEDAKKTHDPNLFYRDWNSSILFYIALDGKPAYQKYHKQKLVPFGEHVPYVEWFPFLGDWFQWGVGLGSWNRGSDINLFELPLHRGGTVSADTARLCTMVCYESVYPSYVRRFVAAGAEVIGIITNDGWYGKSSGPYQHNRYAMLRAVENRRWVIRSANTGISSVIDDNGRIVEERPLFESASITHRIPLLTNQTIYTKFGDVLAVPCEWLFGALIVLLTVLHFRTPKERHES